MKTNTSIIQILLDVPVNYHMSGKFEAPSAQWMHEIFPLNDFELIVVTRGTLYLEYSRNQFVVGENQYLLLPPLPEPDNIRKGFKASSCSFYWLHFGVDNWKLLLSRNKNDGMKNNREECLQENSKNVAFLWQEKTVNTAKLITLMKQIQSNSRSGYDKMSLNYETTSLLCELAFQVSEKYKQKNRLTQNEIYLNVKAYIRENLKENLRVCDIAQHFGYNEKYLSQMFCNFCGISLKQFILKLKMEQGNYLLADTNLSVCEIAAKLGYSDVHNFTKIYKKHTGISPTAYREAYARRLLYHV